MMTFCTLFDHNYLDKGITMYESLERVSNDFVLYVLCISDKCYTVLSDLSYSHLIPIRLADFETDELLEAKKTRSVGEYCWTCSASLVDYIIRTYNPDSCTYIDSDLYFYSDPHCVLDEMERKNASVQITGHRFNSYDNKKLSWRVGRYCVEFNTFKNNEKGRGLLDIWRRQCLDYCKCDGDGIHWADQKYMDNWVSDYEYVIETENLGTGIAPWNIAQYRMIADDEYGPTLIKCRGKEFVPVFYHFQDMRYIDEHSVHTNTQEYWGVDPKLVRALYIPYIKHLAKNKQMLKEKYGVCVLLHHHPGVNDILKKSLKERFFHIINKIITRDFWCMLYFHKLPALLSVDKGIVKY